MAQYIARRLLLMIPTLLGITFVAFMIIRLAPGDPVAFRLGTAGAGADAQEGAGQASADRERQILKAKVRLGLMREGGTVRFWDAAAGRERHHVTGLAAEVKCLAVAPGGARIAAGCADGSIVLWTNGGERVATLTGHAQAVNGLAFSPDAKRMASASDDGTLRVWRAAGESFEEERILKGHDGIVHAVAFAPDGARLASGSRDRTARVWDLRTGNALARLQKHAMDVTAVAFTDDGRLLSGSRDRRVIAWDLEAAQPVVEADVFAAVRGMALNPSGELLAVALDNGAVQLRDARTLEARAELSGHLAAVSSVAFLAQGETLVSASVDKSIRLWDVRAREPRALLTGHTSQVNAVAAAGSLVVSGALEAGKVPLLRAYGDWVSRLVRLDLGRSFKDGRPVMEKVGEALPITLKLNVTAILLTYLLSIPIGVLAAARRGKFFDQASSLALFVLYSMPSFWVATMLIIIVGSPAGFFAKTFEFTLPFVNIHSENAARMPYLQYLKDHFLHLILPVIALTYGSFAFLSQLVRTGMLEVLGLDFVRTARAKGLAERTVVAKHALRNSLIPVTTVLGNILPALIGGSVVVEYIFSIPGMGWLGFDAILQRDYPVVMAITTLAAILTMLGILLSDILYCIVDPRIKLS
jgi:peptide/nickel transport system permease protein